MGFFVLLLTTEQSIKYDLTYKPIFEQVWHRKNFASESEIVSASECKMLEAILQFFGGFSVNEQEFSPVTFVSSMQFVLGLLISGWIAFAIDWKKKW